MEQAEEGNHATVGSDPTDRARLCGSYRLWVWLVLGLGSSLSFISLSSQAAVFTCRRLASAHLAASDETQPTASWDETQPTASWDKTQPTASWDETQPTASWEETQSTASWDETQPTASWTGTQINASLDEMRRDDSWDGRYTQVALSQTGTTYDETLVSHETEKTQSLGVASDGEGGLEGTRGPPASVRNDSTTTVNGTAAYNKWTKSSEGWVLAAISIGYYVIQLPVAVISVHLGSCRVVLVATCICVMMSFLSVPALYWGPLASGVVCFVKGASAGALYPALTSLASVWSGKTETSLVTAVVESGLQVGHAASFLAAACFCDGNDGWSNVFYAHAVVGAVFAVMFWMTVEETPAEKTKCVTMQRIPYKSILTSLPVIAIVVAQFGSEWLDCLMVASLPEFLGVRHAMNEKLVEVLTSAGFLLSIPVAVVGAKVADWLLDNCPVSASTVRKAYDVLSKGIPALCFLLLSYLDSRQVVLVAVVYVVSACSFGLTDSAWPANCFDLAPSFTGFLISLGEGLTAWIWAVCVVVVAYIAPQDTAEQWQTVMYVTTGLMCACVLFYVVFASSEQQEWATAQSSNDSETK